MATDLDFERAWLAKLSGSLDELAGEEVRREVMVGSEDLSDWSTSEEVIDWSVSAMERLDSLVDQERRQWIMAGCACRYPPSELEAIRQTYEETGDVVAAHQVLQERFEFLLRDSLHLSDDIVEDVVARGWGAAGILEGREVIATKIPKSGNLVEYLGESDPERRRQLYCHCPRVRDVLETSRTLSSTYCYCGAGYYKSIWEGILQRPVEVEVLESVLKGDDVCKVAIRLPLVL